VRLDYDPDIDAAYIWLKAAADGIQVAKTVPLDPTEIDGEINLDFDRDGRLVGIEIQSASRFLDPALIRQADDAG
jgi:uncharacterized protein YuzE